MQTVYPTDTRTVKASTYQNMTARAAQMASEYHIHDERTTRTGFEIVLHGNSTDKSHTLAVSDYQVSCDCRSFFYFGACSHCLALPALHVSFASSLNLEIASCEKRENFLIDKDIEKGLAMRESVEMKELQGRLVGLSRCGTITDAISALFRLHAMARRANQ